MGEIILEFPLDLVATMLPGNCLGTGSGTLELRIRMPDIASLVYKVNFDDEK